MDVTVGLGTVIGKGTAGTFDILTGMTSFQSRILKKCLGDSDGNISPPNEILSVLGESFSWQYGNRYQPHLIKLVDKTPGATSDLCPGVVDNIRGTRLDGGRNQLCSKNKPVGFYALIVFDPVTENYKLMNRPAGDYSATAVFSIYTTTGVVQMVSDNAVVYTNQSTPYSNTIYTAYVPGTTSYPNYRGNIDCETNMKQTNGATDCLEVNKLAFFLDPSLSRFSYNSNPKYLNMYRIKKISNERRLVPDSGGALEFQLRPEIVLDAAITSNWELGLHQARAFTFTPPTNGYEYVSECSGRGECDDSTGICFCYSGFDLDNCGRMTASANLK
jgi:hypothetical protein